MTFHASNNQFSRFSLQYEPSTINKSSSRHLCLETFSNILTFSSHIFHLLSADNGSVIKQLQEQQLPNGFEKSSRHPGLVSSDNMWFYSLTILFRSGETSSTYRRTRCKRCKQLLYTYCNSAEHSANHQIMVDMRRTPDNLAEP